MTAALQTHRGELVLALIIGVPLLLVVFAKLGDLVPAILMFATAGFDIFILPGIPGAPNACMAHYNDPCTGKTTWIFGLCILAPLAVCVLYKEMRGDGRGTKGKRLP